jgi:cytosine/uracil/thiamine/allantoin permease
MGVYTWAWFVGLGIALIVYTALMRLKRAA